MPNVSDAFLPTARVDPGGMSGWACCCACELGRDGSLKGSSSLTGTVVMMAASKQYALLGGGGARAVVLLGVVMVSTKLPLGMFRSSRHEESNTSTPYILAET